MKKHLWVISILLMISCLFTGRPALCQVRIMPLGDSITRGDFSGEPDEGRQTGYRLELWNRLRQNGYDVDFVGSLNSGFLNAGFDSGHEGHSGWTAYEILNGRLQDPQAGNLASWLNTYRPEIVLLHIGTNGLEDSPNGLAHPDRVESLVVPDEQEIDEVPGARRPAALVHPRAGVQLLGDLSLEGHEPDLDRAEPELDEQTRTPGRPSIPGIGCGDADIDLQRLEQPPREGALQPVTHGQANSARAELFGSREREAEVVARLRDGRTLKIASGRSATDEVIRVQVDRSAGARAQPGLEREPSLDGPAAWRDRGQAHGQPLETGLTTQNVRRNAELASALAELRLGGRAKRGRGGVVTHSRRHPGWLSPRGAAPVPSAASRPREARPT